MMDFRHIFCQQDFSVLSLHSTDNEASCEVLLEERIDADDRQDRNDRDRHTDRRAGKVRHVNACQICSVIDQELNVVVHLIQILLDTVEL